jgi:hypothetical protein
MGGGLHPGEVHPEGFAAALRERRGPPGLS